MFFDAPENQVFIADLRRRAEANYGKREISPYVLHEDLVRWAKTYAPETIKPTVSSFADWVFGLSNDFVNGEAAKRRGKKAEAEIVESVLKSREQKEWWDRVQVKRKMDMAYYIGKRFSKDLWQLEYDGTANSCVDALQISALKVNGQPLQAKPDLVFRDRRSGDVLIMELKAWNGRGKLPVFGWPNLKMQLWCYGMIDKWRDAPSIILQSRVWRWDYDWDDENDTRGGGLIVPGLVLQPWLSTDPRVHNECLELFKAFGGFYEGAN